MYKIVQIIMAHIIPRGKSLCGFLHSSAVVEIAINIKCINLTINRFFVKKYFQHEDDDST